LKSYFSAWFRIFDSAIIIASFIVDVVLSGVVGEAVELVVVLRLWRIFKIIEEISAGASLEMDDLVERIRDLESENHELKSEIRRAQRDLGGR
jgi:hypothetical protein